MKSTLFFVSLFITGSLYAQAEHYKQLIDTATNEKILFVQRKPLTEFELDIKDTSDYQEDLLEGIGTKHKIDNKVLTEIINNSKHPDTTFWSDSELDKFILVKDREEDVSMKYVINKFNLNDKNKVKAYRKIINRYNQTEQQFRDIFSFSKPVFDDSRQFSIVCYDKGHSGPGCRGRITLYHFSADNWQLVGVISTCNY